MAIKIKAVRKCHKKQMLDNISLNEISAMIEMLVNIRIHIKWIAEFEQIAK